jgi:aminopeptidase I
MPCPNIANRHSIRATTGSLDPGLGVKIFKGFFDHFEAVDKEFE